MRQRVIVVSAGSDSELQAKVDMALLKAGGDNYHLINATGSVSKTSEPSTFDNVIYLVVLTLEMNNCKN